MGQTVTIFDLLLDENGKAYAPGCICATKSSFSTTVSLGDKGIAQEVHVSNISNGIF